MEYYFPEPLFSVRGIMTAYYEKKDVGFFFSGEMHNFWELVYVVDGKIGISEDDRVYGLSQGQLIFHKPMEFHKIWSVGEKAPTVLIISFAAEGNDSIQGLGDGVFTVEIGMLEQIKEVYFSICEAFDLFVGLIRKKTNSNYFTEKAAILKLELFMLEILRGTSPDKTQNHSAGAQNYRNIIRTLNDNLDKNLSLDEIAEHCGLGVSNMKKIFAKYAGGGINRYYIRLKINKSKRLIAQGMSMAQISDALGFTSQNYFSAVFRRETGILPTQYKRQVVSE